MLYLMIFGHALDDHVQVYPGVRYTRFPRARPGDDERAAERVRQQFVVADPVQDHRQSRVRAAAAAVALGDVFGAYVLASVVRGLAVGVGVFIITVWFTQMTFRRAAVDHRVRAAGRGDSRHAWA